jgi:sugar lactone lactonase YvrE
MTIFTATPASAARHVLAEGPVWVAATSRLLWVDVETGTVFAGRIVGDGDGDGQRIETTDQYDFDGMVGAVVDGDDGSLLVAASDRLVVIVPDGSRRDGPRLTEDTVFRANDGAVDPAGRFLIGTYHYDERHGEDTLRRLEFDGSMTVIDDDLSISNGLAWSPDGSRFYSADTARGVIWVRDYDVASGGYGPRSIHLTIDDGYPDGITIDSRGHLWIAIWGGFAVRSYAPDGTPGDTVEVAAPHVSSVCFVGDRLDRLLITTSSRDLDAAERERYPDAGRLFIADVGVAGLPTTPWRSSALKKY